MKVEHMGLATLYHGDNRRLQGLRADALVSGRPMGWRTTPTARGSGGAQEDRAELAGATLKATTDFDPVKWLDCVWCYGVATTTRQRLPKGTTLVWLKTDHLFGTFLVTARLHG